MPYADKAQQIENAKAWAKNNPEKRKEIEAKYSKTDKGRLRARAYRLKTLYGMTLDDYDHLYSLQGGKCAICKETDSKSSQTQHFMVDHCHTTGNVRGLLCHDCNTGLGRLQDNIEVLQAAIQYLLENANGTIRK